MHNFWRRITYQKIYFYGRVPITIAVRDSEIKRRPWSDIETLSSYIPQYVPSISPVAIQSNLCGVGFLGLTFESFP